MKEKNSVLLESGPKTVPQKVLFMDDQTVPLGHWFGAIYFFEWKPAVKRDWSPALGPGTPDIGVNNPEYLSLQVHPARKCILPTAQCMQTA